MATTIIPAGETRPVRIPKKARIDIVENPTGIVGYVLLHDTVPPEKIDYPLPGHPHPTPYLFPNDICVITNFSVVGSYVEIIAK
jgi:hypothetical protein